MNMTLQIKKKVDIVILVPIASDRDLNLATELVEDIRAYFVKSYHIVFIDDSKNFKYKNFRDYDYTTIWSGCQAIKEKNRADKRLVQHEDTIFFVVASGLQYIYNNFEFKIAQYMDSDATVIDKGLDNWLFDIYNQTEFDLLGVLDDEASNYWRLVNDDRYCEIIPALKKNIEKVQYIVDSDAIKFPIIFYAIHFYSYKAVKILNEVNEQFAILRSVELNRQCNVMTAETHLCTLIRLLGLKIVCYGGMSQSPINFGSELGKSGNSYPPIWGSFLMHGTYNYTIPDLINLGYKVVHRLHGLCGLTESAARKQLTSIRQKELIDYSELNYCYNSEQKLNNHINPKQLKNKFYDFIRSLCDFNANYNEDYLESASSDVKEGLAHESFISLIDNLSAQKISYAIAHLRTILKTDKSSLSILKVLDLLKILLAEQQENYLVIDINTKNVMWNLLDDFLEVMQGYFKGLEILNSSNATNNEKYSSVRASIIELIESCSEHDLPEFYKNYLVSFHRIFAKDKNRVVDLSLLESQKLSETIQSLKYSIVLQDNKFISDTLVAMLFMNFYDIKFNLQEPIVIKWMRENYVYWADDYKQLIEDLELAENNYFLGLKKQWFATQFSLRQIVNILPLKGKTTIILSINGEFLPNEEEDIRLLILQNAFDLVSEDTNMADVHFSIVFNLDPSAKEMLTPFLDAMIEYDINSESLAYQDISIRNLLKA